MKLGPITDPNLLGLLREISADPKSRLMKLITQGSDMRPGLREPSLSGREPFLTRAERHLVTEHRHQVAQLLFEAAKMELLESSQQETLVYKGPHSGWTPVLGRGRLDEESAFLRDHSASDPEAILCLAELGPRARSTGARCGQTLAFASLRLVPRDSVRNLIGLTCIPLGVESGGNGAWHDILSHRASDWYRSVALQNMAFEHGERGEALAAKTLYRESHCTRDSRPEPLVGLLGACLLTADEEGALFAASALGELSPSAVDPCIQEHLILLEWIRLARRLVSEETSAFCGRILDRLPDAAARLAHSYMDHSGEGMGA